MKSALITGISGQDGIYMAELLLKKNYKVFGTTRNIDSSVLSIPQELVHKIQLFEWDLSSSEFIINLLDKYKFDEIYNFAAFTLGSKMYEFPIQMTEINGLGVTRILEAIRNTGLGTRFLQASSREIFGFPKHCPQSELTPISPRNPYGVSKLYSDFMVQIYREKYGIFCCSAILFNHESPYRGLDFVTRKITNQACKIKLGLASELLLGDLEATRDWGFAGDFVMGMWLMLQNTQPVDYVLATGVSHSVREFCDLTFQCLGLDYIEYVKEDDDFKRLTETVKIIGDPTKAFLDLNWSINTSFDKMIEQMVAHDLSLLKLHRIN